MNSKIIFCEPFNEGLKDEIHRLRYNVFVKYGYFPPGNNDGMDIDEFDEASIHFVAMQDEEVVGSIRMIKHSRRGFPIEKEFVLDEIPLAEDIQRANIVEISRLVTKDLPHRDRQKVLIGLIKAIFDYSFDHDLYFWYLAADIRLYRLLSRFSFAFSTIGDIKEYLGSPTIPACIDIRAGIEYLDKANPGLARFLRSKDSSLDPDYIWYQFRR